ncbi:hypothetical protein BX666DRAFT_2023014 [Dichotomocladium elegans]|nr:hypothetical protein BX666DRAFT_2023014 [Dichotomocladium elegans]
MNTPPASPMDSITRVDPTTSNNNGEAQITLSLQPQLHEHETPTHPSPATSVHSMNAMPTLDYRTAYFDTMSAETTPLMYSDMVLLDYWNIESQGMQINPETRPAPPSLPQPAQHRLINTFREGEETTVTATYDTPSISSTKAITPSQKRHTCTLCDRSFTRLTDLRRHRRTSLRHNPKQYTCKYCNHIFTRPHDVRRHAANAHGIL